MPIHRLGEEPTGRGVLADITCDSDGKVDRFIDRRDVKSVLELHPYTGDDYFLAAFLVGALLLTSVGARRQRVWTPKRVRPEIAI